jgi:hypothetical protein
VEIAPIESTDNPTYTEVSTPEYKEPSPEELYHKCLRSEQASFHQLVEDGAQPWYSLDMLTDVLQHPEKHEQLLRFFRGDHPDRPPRQNYKPPYCVFSQQLARWCRFRRWQPQARMPTEDSMTLTEYNNNAKECLAKIGVTKQFTLEEDPAAQDRLVTWLEYLLYEYTVYLRSVWCKRFRKMYSAAWEKLAESKALLPDEDEYTLFCIRNPFEVEIERQRLRKDLQLARRASVAQQGKSGTAAAVDDASKALLDFEKREKLISEFVDKFSGYWHAEHEMLRQEIMYRWVADQIPLIESEMSQNALDGDGESSNSAQANGLSGANDITNTEEESIRHARHMSNEPDAIKGEVHTAARFENGKSIDQDGIMSNLGSGDTSEKSKDERGHEKVRPASDDGCSSDEHKLAGSPKPPNNDRTGLEAARNGKRRIRSEEQLDESPNQPDGRNSPVDKENSLGVGDFEHVNKKCRSDDGLGGLHVGTGGDEEYHPSKGEISVKYSPPPANGLRDSVDA